MFFSSRGGDEDHSQVHLFPPFLPLSLSREGGIPVIQLQIFEGGDLGVPPGSHAPTRTPSSASFVLALSFRPSTALLRGPVSPSVAEDVPVRGPRRERPLRVLGEVTSTSRARKIGDERLSIAIRILRFEDRIPLIMVRVQRSNWKGWRRRSDP